VAFAKIVLLFLEMSENLKNNFFSEKRDFFGEGR
jgi:hypothetical protein